jgi:hypothetical protein
MTLMAVSCKRRFVSKDGTCEETESVCFWEIKLIARLACYRSFSPCLYLNISMSVYFLDSMFRRISYSALILKPFEYETFEMFLLNRSFSPATGSTWAATGFIGLAGVSLIAISV